MADIEKPHILLVEDYKANVLVATALLEEFGYEYTVASNGREAIQLIRQKPFDLVLMDVQMPGLDGFEATRAVRLDEMNNGHRRVPIIGVTAHVLAGDRERCLSAGMDDYIAKPFHPEEFRHKIEKQLTMKTFG